MLDIRQLNQQLLQQFSSAGIALLCGPFQDYQHTISTMNCQRIMDAPHYLLDALSGYQKPLASSIK